MNMGVIIGLLLCVIAVNARTFRGEKDDYQSSFRNIDPPEDNYRRVKHNCQHNYRKNDGRHYWKNKYENDLTKILYILNDIVADINKPTIIPVPYPYFIPINTNKTDVTFAKFDIEDYLRKFDAINKVEETGHSNSYTTNTEDLLRKMLNFTAENKQSEDDNKDSHYSKTNQATVRPMHSAQVNFDIGKVPEMELRLSDYRDNDN